MIVVVERRSGTTPRACSAPRVAIPSGSPSRPASSVAAMIRFRPQLVSGSSPWGSPQISRASIGNEVERSRGRRSTASASRSSTAPWPSTSPPGTPAARRRARVFGTRAPTRSANRLHSFARRCASSRRAAARSVMGPWTRSTNSRSCATSESGDEDDVCVVFPHEGARVLHPGALVEVDCQEPAGLVLEHGVDAHDVLAFEVCEHGGVVERAKRLLRAVAAFHLGQLAYTGDELVRAGRGVAWFPSLLADEARRVEVWAATEELTK